MFEQRDRVGGVWNLSGTERSRSIPLPQTNPRYGAKPAYGGTAMTGHQDESYSSQESLEFESPLYDYLETNIPKQLMAYSDQPFPEDAPLFPRHQTVLEYLEDYAKDVHHLIHFNTQVQDVRLDESASQNHETWQVRTKKIDSKETGAGVYDAVVVANGHYTVPYVPDIEGMTQWNQAYPERVIHSKAYRRPEDFKELKVVVVGNSASGLDIAAQVGKHSKHPLLLSSRSISAFGPAAPAPWRQDVDELVEFLPPAHNKRALRFRSGRVEEKVDVVIFATGYFYSFPFLSSLDPPIITDGFRIKDIYQHMFHITHPGLVFPVVNLKVIPFPLAQNQAAVIARIWSGRLSLPSEAQMRGWESKNIEKKGNGKYFHVQKFPEDAAQINELYRWALSAKMAPHLENGGKGKLGTMWDSRQVWIRSQFPDIKNAYGQNGEDKYRIRSIEELGFDYAKWRQGATTTDMEIFTEAKC